ncbi:MAG TPA: aminoglycoside 6-adenylyltransferase [Candidatus Merdivicinus intestinavium]|nr:aminoglycoside 6-adenylyltransferase [Candidatus Merdivicinus intestinavium]
MRTDAEMMALFLDFARESPAVRAVGMEGSRLNPNVPADPFRDFDLTYFVTEMEAFTRDDGWLDRFGERLILQKPEGMELFPPEEPGFSYLMLFADFTKADLTLLPVSGLPEYLAQDSLRAILLDKDGRVPEKPVPSDRDYRLKRPTPRSFDDCCNEFWNLSHYVARGICREALFYAARHLDLMREELFRMLGWEAGFREGFSFSLGKQYRFLDRHMDPARWDALAGTYNLGSLSRVRAALGTCRELFSESSRRVAAALGCPYPDYEEKVSRYLDYYLKG